MLIVPNVVEVACSLCTETVDLGNGSSGAYECPYCNEEFIWHEDKYSLYRRRVKRSRRKERNVQMRNTILKNQGSKNDLKFPLLIGNSRPRLIFDHVQVTINVVMFPFYFIGKIFQFFQLLSHKMEYSKSIFNPDYLQGSGLMVLPDLSATLICKPWVPALKLGIEDITKIVLHEERRHRGIWSVYSEYTLNIYLDNKHVLTLYGLNLEDSENVVGELLLIYDIEFEYSLEVIEMAGGEGGGGGG